MTNDKVFIAGASGMVGSAIIRALIKNGYTDIIGSYHSRRPDSSLLLPEGYNVVAYDSDEFTLHCSRFTTYASRLTPYENRPDQPERSIPILPGNTLRSGLPGSSQGWRHRPTVYHVISRTALPGFPLGDIEKDKLLDIIRYFSKIYFVDILGFAIMGNHWHLAVKVYPHEYADRDEVKERFASRYGEDIYFGDKEYEKFSKKWTDLSEFVREIKQSFSRYYNKRHNRLGFFWGERFKSMIVQEGRTLVNMLAYIDLNPIRAGIVKNPENYRWCSLGYHTQTGNKDGLLSIDFGMKEWNEFDPKAIVRKYRQFVYETGAVDAGKGKTMDKKIVEKARKKGYKISRVDRFRYRCRYFTDSGIIGGKDFVQEVFDQVKHLLGSKDERKFTPVGGVEGVYSMKRLRAS